MDDVLVWPASHLPPRASRVSPMPFTRSGGRSLSGLRPSVRTDRGWWSIVLTDIPVWTVAQRRTWNAIRQHLGGTAGVIAVPAWSFDSAPYADGADHRGRSILTPHSDDAMFSDGTGYQQGRIVVRMAETVPIGATQCVLNVVHAAGDLSGVRFSYDHALYETGPAIEIDGPLWTVPISMPCRYEIPAGAELNFDMPTCLCRLADDRGMEIDLDASDFTHASVAFVEATDVWSNLAAEAA